MTNAVRTEVKLDRSVVARYVGVYELTPNFSITFTLNGDQLMTQATNQPMIRSTRNPRPNSS
jgi:hypothetical protein